MRDCPGCGAVPTPSAAGPAREIQARAEALDFGELPGRAETRLAGLLLAIPDLIALGLPDTGHRRRLPVHPEDPRPVVRAVAAGAQADQHPAGLPRLRHRRRPRRRALFAGLTALPKATALTTYSYRLEHRKQAAFLAALDKAAIAAGLADGEATEPGLPRRHGVGITLLLC